MTGHPVTRCVVLGAGGHAKEVIEAMRACGIADPYAVLGHNSRLRGKDVLGAPIRGDDGVLPQLLSEGVTCFVVGLGGVGDNKPRQRLYEIGLHYGLRPINVVHPSAICSPSARVGEGTVLLAGSIVNAGVVIGANVIVNTGAIIEHDCVLGDHVHVATGARLAGTVRVEKGAHVGIGATIRQCLTIGEGAIVGAGAVVVKDVAPGSVVVGVPARPLSVRARS